MKWMEKMRIEEPKNSSRIEMMKKGKRWAMEKGGLVAARGRPESTEKRKKS